VAPIELFDGESLTGWTPPRDDGTWGVTDGAIHCVGGDGGLLRSDGTYGDFRLDLAYRHEPGANSGVYVWWSDPDRPNETGFEVQIIDTSAPPYDDGLEPRQRCGALYDLAPPLTDATRPPGVWNDLRIVCDDPTIEAWLNGERVLDVDVTRWTEAGTNPDGSPNKFDVPRADLPRHGHIGLQDHGDEVRFRGLELRPL
jgi:hypothetical protein